MLTEYTSAPPLEEALADETATDTEESTEWPDSRWRTVLGHVVLAGLSLLSVFPVYWMFVTSFKAPHEIYNLSLVPRFWRLENYSTVWDTIPIGRMLLNTFRMAALQTL